MYSTGVRTWMGWLLGELRERINKTLGTVPDSSQSMHSWSVYIFFLCRKKKTKYTYLSLIFFMIVFHGQGRFSSSFPWLPIHLFQFLPCNSEVLGTWCYSGVKNISLDLSLWGASSPDRPFLRSRKARAPRQCWVTRRLPGARRRKNAARNSSGHSGAWSQWSSVGEPLPRWWYRPGLPPPSPP